MYLTVYSFSYPFWLFLFCLFWWYLLYILSRGVKINKLVTLACRLSGGRRLDRFLVFAPRRSCHRIDQKKKKIGFCSFLSLSRSLQLRPKGRIGLTRLLSKCHFWSSLLKSTIISTVTYACMRLLLFESVFWIMQIRFQIDLKSTPYTPSYFIHNPYIKYSSYHKGQAIYYISYYI